MGEHPIPEHIIERFAGKVMAITGYEQDQVMVEPVGKPGVQPESDVSVPINWAYNHHCTPPPPRPTCSLRPPPAPNPLSSSISPPLLSAQTWRG